VRRHRSSDDRGTDPAALVRQPDRVVHTHLKDVDQAWAMRVQRGDVYTAAVVGGMYRPLGHGDVDIAGIVDTLEAGGYAGWYVLEQDTVLAGDPEGEGPVEDVRASVAYLRGLA
jgi:inosose dehydratase